MASDLGHGLGRVVLRRTKDLETVQRLDEELIGEDLLTAGQLTVSKWWLASVGGQLAGYCGVKESTAEWAYLIRSGVLPSFRGLSIQRRMIKTRVRWARENGMLAVVTDTAVGNVWSSNNLIHCGFRLFVPEPVWVDDNTNYWRLDL